MKNMNFNWIRVTALAVISTVGLSSVALAQPPGGGRPPQGGQRGGPGGPGGPDGGGLARQLGGMLGWALDLTDAQRTQVRTIVTQAMQGSQALANQLRTLREQELAAVKANKSEQELRSLAQSSATLLAQLHGAQLVTEAKVYQVLTPAQRDKLERIRTAMRQARPNFFPRPEE